MPLFCFVFWYREHLFASRTQEIAVLREFSDALVRNLFPKSLWGHEVHRCALNEIVATKGKKSLNPLLHKDKSWQVLLQASYVAPQCLGHTFWVILLPFRDLSVLIADKMLYLMRVLLSTRFFFCPKVRISFSINAFHVWSLKSRFTHYLWCEKRLISDRFFIQLHYLVFRLITF